MSNNFNKLPLSREFLKNIESLGFKEMTTIQNLAIEPILDKNDVVVSSSTGSGKSVTFGIPIVHNLKVKKFRVQSLIIAPTRELSTQVAKSIRELSRHIHNVKILVLCGGVPKRPQINSLSHGAHIVVGTAGRVLDHLKNENLNLDDIEHFVLDEADKMLNMGFMKDINSIISYLPKERQNMLFSATYPEEIEELTQFMSNPKFIENRVSTPDIQEYFIQTRDRLKTLENILLQVDSQSILIFTNQKIKSDEVAEHLHSLGYSADALHSDLEQYDRDEILLMFANKSLNILVASDIVSRGIDIADVGCVINYEVPFKSEVYVHRIGRSARGADSNGLAYTLVGDEDRESFKNLEKYRDKKYQFSNIEKSKNEIKKAKFRTIRIHSGKKHKMRAGDIVGAICRDDIIAFKDIGKIDVLAFYSYVAISSSVFDKALKLLQKHGIKNKKMEIIELS